MTDISTDDQELIDRYLANRLSEVEEHVIETRIVEDPAFRTEVELTSAFKDGMRELEVKGKVAPLLVDASRTRRRLQFAIAASLGAIALGLGSYLLYPRDEADPYAVTETLRFEPTRGTLADADATWTQSGTPTLLEMRFDPGLNPAAAYDVTIVRADRLSASVMVRQRVVTSAEGEVLLRVEGALLGPGEYAIHLDPTTATGSGEPLTYTLAVN